MPRYNYECLDCHEVFVAFHAMSEDPCPCSKCQSTNLKKLLSKPYFKTEKKDAQQNKVGDLVNSSIEEFRQDLKKQKEGMLSEARTND